MRDHPAKGSKSEPAGARVGVWIDHRIAYIVRPATDDCAIESVESGLTQRHHSTGGKAKSRPFMHENSASSGSHFDDAWENGLKKFYHRVSETLGPVADVVVLGPGQAKFNFRELLAAAHPALRIQVETAEQMTEPQLKEKIMCHFGRPAKRDWPDTHGQPRH